LVSFLCGNSKLPIQGGQASSFFISIENFYRTGCAICNSWRRCLFRLHLSLLLLFLVRRKDGATTFFIIGVRLYFLLVRRLVSFLTFDRCIFKDCKDETSAKQRKFNSSKFDIDDDLKQLLCLKSCMMIFQNSSMKVGNV